MYLGKYYIINIGFISKILNFVFVFQSLQADLQEHKGSLEYINKTGKDLITKAGTQDKAAKLDKDLKSLNSRWSHFSMVIEERLDKLEKAIGQLKQYQVSD